MQLGNLLALLVEGRGVKAKNLPKTLLDRFMDTLYTFNDMNMI